MSSFFAHLIKMHPSKSTMQHGSRIVVSTLLTWGLSPCWPTLWYVWSPLSPTLFSNAWWILHLVQFVLFAFTITWKHAIIRFMHVILVCIYPSQILLSVCVAYDYTDWLIHLLVFLGLATHRLVILYWVWIRVFQVLFILCWISFGWTWLGLVVLLVNQMYLFEYFRPYLNQYEKRHGPTWTTLWRTARGY